MFRRIYRRLGKAPNPTDFTFVIGFTPWLLFALTHPSSGFGLVLLLLLVPFLVFETMFMALKRREENPVHLIAYLGSALSCVIAMCSATYWALSYSDPNCFSEPLGRVDSIYFTLATFTSTGFGDIHAMTVACRAAVSTQMVFDLAIVGVALAVVLARFTNSDEASGG